MILFCVFLIFMFSANDLQLCEPYGRAICPSHWERSRDVNTRLVDLECWYVYEGKGIMQINGKEYLLRPGFFVLMQPGNIYTATQDFQSSLGVNYIHFDGPRSWFQSHFTKPIYSLEINWLDEILKKIQRSFQMGHYQRSKEWLFLLLQDLKQNQDPRFLDHQTSQIQNCIQWIRESEKVPMVSECASHYHWSLAHFSREFQKVIGKPPAQFLIQEKINRSKYYLKETSFQISEIAELLNFCDVYFFSKQFKQFEGVSPSAFRKAEG